MGNSDDAILEENKHFYDIKTGLKESMVNINKTLDSIKTWDELINLKEESIENNRIKKTKTIKKAYSCCCISLCTFCGILSIIFQLITVQGCIIILNSLFDEIVEEFKLWLNNTQRKYNFYEYIEINSYKELPEIDIGMITSSVGIIFLKNFGFICSNITFQLLSLVWFLLLFLLFEFHSGDKLLENYSRLEIVVLILSYIGLSFLVGCSSTIGLKEYTDKYFNVYDKSGNKDDNEKTEKFMLFLFSGISIFIIMQINRKIFTSFEITSKWILKWIIIICFISFGMTMVFHGLFCLPITTKKDVIKKNPNYNNQDAINKEEIEEGKENQNEEEKGNQNEDKKDDILIINNIKIENENKNYLNTEMASFKINQSFPQNKTKIEEIRETKIEQKNKNKIFSTKICTLCGYIYLRKKTTKKSTCIIYYYTNMCTWLNEKICNADILTPALIELFCQVCIIGFNPILTEKLLNEYSYSKNFKFYIALIILSLFFGIMIVYLCEFDMKGKKDCCDKFLNFFQLSSLFLVTFIIFTFICSICYLCDDNITRERWNNIIMTEFIFFKILDFQILTFYDFFDNSDIFNTTLAITLEKLLWMVIETRIEAFVKNKKILVIIQIIVISLLFGFFIFGIIIAAINDCK